MSQLWAKYNQLLVTKPIITKGLTGGTLFAIGDLLAQYIDGTLSSPQGYNPRRTAIGFCWSSCIFTPLGHQWYSKFLPKHFPTSNIKDSALKMICDQTAFAAGINGLYLTYSTLAQGGSFDDARLKVKQDWWSVLKANWYLWPAVQMFTFTCIPIPLQLPVMNVAVLFWSCYLALVGSKKANRNLDNITPPSNILHSSQPLASRLDHNDSKLNDLASATSPPSSHPQKVLPRQQ